VELDDSAQVKLSWTPASNTTTQVLTATTFDGVPPREIPLGLVSEYRDDTHGVATCYVLEARLGSVRLGRANTVCAVPGISTLGTPAASTSAGRALGAAVERIAPLQDAPR
jgi:hypothetical protein